MPSMFSSSRRRGSSTSRTRSMDQSTTNAATLAARSAAGGLRTQASSGSLSSAAAAAALRSAATTPEPVGSIQTKRMIRRGSQSSVGSGSVAGPMRGALQRQTSSGSMTDRTFRSPSPGSNGYANGAASPDPYAPPVPAIPSGHRRSSSMEPPQGQRVLSPNRAPRGRGVSADRASLATNSSRKPPRLSDVAEIEELERSDSNRKLNFSRPRAQAGSPLGSPTMEKKFTHGTGAWHSEPIVNTATSKQGTSAAATEQKIARIQSAAGQSVRSSNAASSSQGAHLTRANLEAVSAAAEEYETVMVFDANSRTFVPQKRLRPFANAPASPVVAKAAPLKPGQYDPSTRTIVPQPAHEQQSGRSQRPIPPALDTSIQPPPRNPARLSPASSPTNGRHPLVKHPSVVREAPEEEETGSDHTDAGRKNQTTAGPSKAYTTPTTKPRSSSLDVPRGAMNGSFRGRNTSASPSPQRARFSASPVVEATIHNPPARDFSPAKSAMKHSPSPSLRAASPRAHFSNPKAPSSETSETPSLVSQDGKKKKSVRVSFDEQPAITEIASPSTPKALDDLDDDDELMKPRPALPSFGSVRKNRSPGYAEKVTEMAPDRSVSNDHAIGGILVNAKGNAKPAADPHPPIVTSKETAGDVSDSDYSADEQGVPTAQSTVADDAQVKSQGLASADGSGAKPDGNVPDINLLPPTPGVEQEAWDASPEGPPSPRARLSKEVVLPGGWTDAVNEPEADIDSKQQPAVASPPSLQAIDEFADSDDDDDAQFSDAAEDLSDMEGGFASLDAIAVSPVAAITPAPKPASPVSPSFQKSAKNVDNEESNKDTPSGDWSQATAYWSTLSRQQREQIEREHFSSDDEARPAPAVKKTKKKTAPRQSSELSPNNAVAAPSQKSVPAQASAQPAKPAMKKSMRAQPGPAPAETQVHLRSSMRAGGGSGMASSLRDGSRQQSTERSGSVMKKTMRPQSSSSAASNNAAYAAATPTLPRQNSQTSVMSQPRTQSRASNQPTQAMSARLQKELRKAEDSDSDSSFRKQRRSARTHAGFAMKTSMRGGPEPPERAAPAKAQRPVSPTPPRTKGRDSFSIRSLSPTGSFFGRKKMNRDPPAAPVDTGVKTLRGAQPQKSSLRTPAAAPTKSSRFRSRFADSDDEDDAPAPPRGGHFSSRFADSDDDDDVFTPVKLAPVRGIPRRQGQNDGDSTDLSDEEEQQRRDKRDKRDKFNAPIVPDPSDVDRAMELARKKLGIPESPAQNGQEGGALAQGSLRDNVQDTKPESVAADTTPKKRGFMGSLLRRNRASTASVPGYQPTATRVSSEAPVLPSVALPDDLDQDVGSPTSPGKLVRRSSYQPKAPRFRRGDSTFSNATAPPAMGETDISDWPLPPVPALPDGYKNDDRPNTTEGTGVRFDEKPQVYSARTGKKKKFSMLRRAFGLHD